MEGIQKIVKILLVEDNLDDIYITERALKQAKVVNELWIVRDGEEALDFLFQRGAYQDHALAPRPGLILLDINLPKKNGLEVLKAIKSNETLQNIPIVMLTVSQREEDISESYKLGCNSYIQKPVEFEKFLEIVDNLGFYWGVINISPQE